MEQRKHDHINLAFQSQLEKALVDPRFYYEPILSAHPTELEPISILGKTMKAPIWISSMTGGAEYAGVINRNLARACKEFGLGMGLGSCRIYLEEKKKYEEQFELRDIIGDEQPFYANLGISQIEKSIKNKSLDQILEMLDTLRVDGLIIHVNPLQEWLQPEGDLIEVPPIETIQAFIEATNTPVVVKEVGQGMGKESIKALLQLPIEALDYAAFGGTNFAKIELLRSTSTRKAFYEPLSYVGNDAEEMTNIVNELKAANLNIKCKAIIASGGIKTFLDGHYLMQKTQMPTIYGQASAFLNYAREDYEHLREFIQFQIKGLQLANAYLKIK